MGSERPSRIPSSRRGSNVPRRGTSFRPERYNPYSRGTGNRNGRASDQRRPLSESDDPPLPAGTRDRTTIGVEFEFLVAACRSTRNIQDPHPNDGRWLTDKLIDLSDANNVFLATVEERIARVMRNAGIVAKAAGEGYLMPPQDLNDDEDMGGDNDQALESWVGSYTWEDSQNMVENCEHATNELAQQFLQHHNNLEIKIFRTKKDTVRAIAQNKLRDFLHGNFDDDSRGYVINHWEYIMLRQLDRYRKMHQEEVKTKKDPNHIPIPGLNDKYCSWGVTSDTSVSGDPVLIGSYNIPPGFIILPPDLSELDSRRLQPPCLYKWFGAEVRTPVLDLDHADTVPAIQRFCGAVRDNFRVHKPMRKVGSGLHIHFGQEAGWTLFHLKKFATLWIVVEELLEHLHRIDRTRTTFCAPLRNRSRLAMALKNEENLMQGEPSCLSQVRNSRPALSARYAAQMAAHVPKDRLDAEYVNFIAEIWQYATIDDLNKAMSSHGMGWASVRWRVSGHKRTGPTTPFVTQTLEVRSMQGTLDANHVRRWLTICGGVVKFAKNASPQQFHDGIEALVRGTNTLTGVIGIPEDNITWMHNHRSGENGYFEYPDKDVVDWSDPFMPRGHGNTHADDPYIS
ncbi:hypothetical protein F5B20DRAFT_596740 [Whalleya microplaca]|nr:hypothetical protein F5B20DRAFT_596740 [Whalleya microplaca]